MTDGNYHDTQSRGCIGRRPGRASRRPQPKRVPSTSRGKHPVHSAAFRKDPSIERSLRRIKGRPEIESASNIISFLARRGTDLQTLRGVAEAIASFKPQWQAVRGLKVLRSAIIKDRQAAVLLPAVFLRNPLILKAKTDSLIIFGRMCPFISESKIIDLLGPEEVEILAAAYRSTLSLFPRPETRDLFFAVLNEKMRRVESLGEKIHIASTWAENLISILSRLDRRCSK
ncbi:MAG: hypothetical protein R6U13_00380 [Desulfatiglandaceae bacterium]